MISSVLFKHTFEWSNTQQFASDNQGEGIASIQSFTAGRKESPQSPKNGIANRKVFVHPEFFASINKITHNMKSNHLKGIVYQFVSSI